MIMWNTHLYRSFLAKAACLTVIAFIAMASVASAQQSFKTPEEAADALASAVRSGDNDGMLKVLGRAGTDIIDSGDDVADATARQQFLTAYDAQHTVTAEGNDKATMIIGKDDFPFPIPLVRKDGQWQFDTTAGREEVLFRRIGRNELDAIQASLAYVDAQNDYADKDRTGAGPGVYAQRIISRPGKTDGLYWPASQSGDASPLGELVAQATGEGYRVGGERAPFHGYYFKILTRQGSAAPGGALDYVVHGKMIGGFGLVAYPADYGNSGMKTFIVNHAGTVYEKDLGPRTTQLAEQMTAFNPDKTWNKVDVSQ
jgi:Protein of unknown function (DUF2950)